MRYETQQLPQEALAKLTELAQKLQQAQTVDLPKAPTLPTPRLWVLEDYPGSPFMNLYTDDNDVVAAAWTLACVREVQTYDESDLCVIWLNRRYVADAQSERDTKAWVRAELERLFPSSGLVATTDDPNGLALEDYSDDFHDDFGDEPDGVGGHV